MFVVYDGGVAPCCGHVGVGVCLLDAVLVQVRFFVDVLPELVRLVYIGEGLAVDVIRHYELI